MRVDYCCCGCSLYAGTKALLWFYLIGSIINILQTFNAIVELEKIHSTDSDYMTIACFVSLFHNIINIVVSINGLVGIENNNRKRLLPFYYLNLYYVGVLSVAFVLLFGYASTTEVDHNLPVISFAFVIVTIALQVHFAIVVKSYYDTMPDDSTYQQRYLSELSETGSAA